MKQFYQQLLAVLRKTTVRDGDFSLLECVPAWDGNWTVEGFVAFGWLNDTARLVVVVNYAGHQGQCSVRVPLADLAGSGVLLADLKGDSVYERAGSDLAATGLYVDLPPWGSHVFEVTSVR